MWYHIVTVVAAVLLVLFYNEAHKNIRPGMCDFLSGLNLDGGSACYFSESYWEARAKFRTLAAAAGAELSTHKVVDGDYTMDIAVLRGTSDGLVVHSSGVHGVEGYAGSAVQCAYLHKRAHSLGKKVSPTLVMVHAVNPFGMAHFRRFNEHNVDLNRNAIALSDWPALLNRDKNTGNYMNFTSMMNPPRAPTFFDAYFSVFVNSLTSILGHGFVAVKQAIVTGQYHFPEGLYYGGQGREPSHSVLWEALSSFADAPGPVTWIDVHTGLGPSGVDTLMVDEADLVETEQPRFDGGEIVGPDTGDVQAGYSLARGFMTELYATRFPTATANGHPPLIMTQEFGTLPGVFVARAMILENQAFQYDRPNQPYWATFTRDAFYVRTATWKASVAARGLTVLGQAIERSTSSSS